jgi:hypothetical protein
MLANTSLLFAPSSGGARYSFTGAGEGDGLADQRQIKLEGMIELDLFAAVGRLVRKRFPDCADAGLCRLWCICVGDACFRLMKNRNSWRHT